MEKTEKTDMGTIKKYLALVSIIHDIEKRLKWSEIAYIFLNIAVFFPTIFFVSTVIHRADNPIHPIDLLFILLCHVFGISINTYWTASSMRLQLKLKLRYFQARFLERKLNCAGENIFSDESLFFNPDIGQVVSPDGKETVRYPNEGLLRMDGFVGSAKPRVLSLLIPLIFFGIYVGSFFTVLTKLL